MSVSAGVVNKVRVCEKSFLMWYFSWFRSTFASKAPTGGQIAWVIWYSIKDLCFFNSMSIVDYTMISKSSALGLRVDAPIEINKSHITYSGEVYPSIHPSFHSHAHNLATKQLQISIPIYYPPFRAHCIEIFVVKSIWVGIGYDTYLYESIRERERERWLVLGA